MYIAFLVYHDPTQMRYLQKVSPNKHELIEWAKEQGKEIILNENQSKNEIREHILICPSPPDNI